MSASLDIMSLIVGAIMGGAGGALFMRGKMTDRSQGLAEENARLKAEAQAAGEKARQHKEDLAEMERKFTLQFENLANRIFDEKSARFKQESQEGLGQMLAPLKERLQEFQKKVDDSFGAQAKEQFSLKREIENIVRVNAQMTQQTESLTRALKGDVKTQGNWGEVVLERILEDSGLRKDIDYILQGADLGLKHVEGGSALKPDVIVMLPDGKHVIVDAKVSLTAYERYCAEQDEAERARHLSEFTASVRRHVDGLKERRYQDTEKLGTPDFVLMFLPIEGAYALAVQSDAALHGYAWDRKIVIVCPSTLFATLRTVASVWRIELQNRNAVEIARQGGNLYDKIAGFVEDMEQLGDKIGAAHRVYDETFRKLSSGPGNILKRTEDLKALGLKTSKKLPAALGGDGEEADTPLKRVEKA